MRAIASPIPDEPPVTNAAWAMVHLPKPEGDALPVANTLEGIRQGSSSPLTGGGFEAAAVVVDRSCLLAGAHAYSLGRLSTRWGNLPVPPGPLPGPLRGQAA